MSDVHERELEDNTICSGEREAGEERDSESTSSFCSSEYSE